MVEDPFHSNRKLSMIVSVSPAVKHEFVEFSPEDGVFGSQLVLDVELVEEVEHEVCSRFVKEWPK